MKSKISFFNSTVFRKNVTMFWPVWTGYLLWLLITVPGMLWLDYMSYRKDVWGGYGVRSFQLDRLAERLNFSLMTVSVCVMAVVTGMLLFHYLCVAKNAYMMHAFPVSRGEFFWTNLITGLVFMIVPQILSFLTSMAVCLSFGMTHVEYLGMYLLLQIGVDLLMYGIVVFCAMVTGQMVAVPVFFVIFNLLYLAIRLLVRAVLSELSYGFDVVIIDRIHTSDVLSPFIYLLERVMVTPVYANNATTGIKFENASCLIWYLIPAAALYLGARLLYRKRALENAGDLVVVGFVRPLFRWGVGFFAAYLSGFVFLSVAYEITDRVSRPFVLAAGLACGAVFFFLAQMLLEKSFHVFRARTVKECIAWCVFMLAGFAALCCFAHIQEHTIPKEQDIKKVIVSCGAQMEFGEECFPEVIDLHREIVDFEDQNYSRQQDLEEAFYLGIVYTLESGREVERTYWLPLEFADRDSFAFVRNKQENPEWFMNDFLFLNRKNYDKYLDMVDIEIGIEDVTSHTLYERGDRKDAAKALYDAILADLRDKSLQKYNLNWQESGEVGAANIYIRISVPADKVKEPEVNEYYQVQMYQTDEDTYSCDHIISFGQDCVHIVEVLEKYGVIRSPGELSGTEN